MFLDKGLLSTNRAPTQEEIEIAKEYLANSNQQRTQVREKIKDVKALLQQLLDQEAALIEAAGPYERVISPFRRLPDDVIRVIFVACLDTKRNPTMSNRDAPMLLTQISSGLRDIALTTPRLWAAIHIAVPADVPPELEQEAEAITDLRAEAARGWLTRSGSLPLSISMHAAGRDFVTGHPKTADKVLTTLTDFSERWRDVVFSCPQETLSRIAAMRESDVPMLRSLSFYFGGGSPVGSPSQNPHIFEESGILRAPQLTEIALYGQGGSISGYNICWANLTRLTLRGRQLWDASNAVATVSNILGQTTQLQSCDIDMSENYITDQTEAAPIHLPFLKVLILYQAIPSPDIPGILPSINAPALEAFQYNMRSEVASEQPLMHFLARTPNIQELGLGCVVSFEELKSYLSCCPTLKILQLQAPTYDNSAGFPPSSNGFLEAFATDDEETCLCPRLEYFRCESTLAVSPKAARKFIMRPKGNIPKWKGLVMSLQCTDDAAVEEIQNIKAEAARDKELKMSIRCYQPYQGCNYPLNDGFVDYGRSFGWQWPTAARNPEFL